MKTTDPDTFGASADAFFSMNFLRTFSVVLVATAVSALRLAHAEQTAVAPAPAPAATEQSAQPSAEAPKLPAGHPPAGHPSLAAAPQASPPSLSSLLRGDPFDSPQHRLQAERIRAGQLRLPRNVSEPMAGVPPGMIAVLLRDAQNRPLSGKTLTLHVVREDIADGNTESELTTTTDSEGRAIFSDRNTDTSYRYEVVYREDSAQYSSGDFRLQRQSGQVVSLHVYPTTTDMNQAFVFSRLLYAVTPREDVFQVQTLLRMHNGSPVTWIATDARLPLPPGAKAFQPQQTPGDLRVRQRDGSLELSGTITPGQHEVSFSFQLPNPGEANVELALPRPAHLADARIFIESSPTMTVMVPGFRAPEPTRGNDGQPALMSSQDFLQAGRAPEVFRVRISGLPTRSKGPYVATLLAAVVALLGVSFAASTRTPAAHSITPEDRQRAEQLLLDELAQLERAFRAEEIGPRTYEQTRRTLLDSLARLQASSSADAEQAA